MDTKYSPLGRIAKGAKNSNTPTARYTQSQARVLNNSTFKVGGNKAGRNVEYDDLPKLRIQSFKKGGMVKKTGLAKLHKGEKVLTVKQVAKSKKKISKKK